MYSRTGGSFTSKCNAYLALSIASRLSKNVLAIYYIFSHLGGNQGKSCFQGRLLTDYTKFRSQDMMKRFSNVSKKRGESGTEREHCPLFLPTPEFYRSQKIAASDHRLKFLKFPLLPTLRSNYIFVSKVLTHTCNAYIRFLTYHNAISNQTLLFWCCDVSEK